MTTQVGPPDCIFSGKWKPYEKPGSQLFSCDTQVGHVHIRVECPHEMQVIVRPLAGVLEEVGKVKKLFSCRCFSLTAEGERP